MNVDLAIVGAGPAGAAAAIVAARHCSRARPLSIALIDKATFPRGKVCGSCLSPAGVAIARSLGIGRTLQQEGQPIDAVSLDTGSRIATMPVTTGGIAIERSRFDAALLQHARELNVTILEGTHAAIERLDDHQATLQITPAGGRSLPPPASSMHLHAKVLIAADGLGSSLADPSRPQGAKVWKRARVGLGCLLDRACSQHYLAWLPDGRMHMLTHQRGYLGLVRLRDGRVDLAAAVDPAFIRDSGNPASALASILASSDRTASLASAMPSCTIRGVPPLTRMRAAQSQSMLRAGDSLQYTEPFTGEGMTWALQAGSLAGAHACRVLRGEARLSKWPAIIAQATTRRRSRCMLLTRLLRWPSAVAAAAWSINHAPNTSRRLLALLGGPWGECTPDATSLSDAHHDQSTHMISPADALPSSNLPSHLAPP